MTLDVATGTANRPYFDLILRQRVAQAHHSRHSLCLILSALDGVDEGARIQVPGGPATDAAMRAVATAFRRVVTRPADLIARYGTGSFATLLPDTGARGGMVVALRTSAAVDDLKLPVMGARSGRHLTLSIGLAIFDERSAEVASAESLMAMAQGALIAARAAGGHAVRAAAIIV